jgi:catechol 2,3-dioxygenase-like lactoylglutathione lyase family enzyme
VDALSLDHLVIHVAEWDRSNAFYRDVLGAKVIERGAGYAYRIGSQQLNCHGSGVDPDPVARVPVAPGNSDLCFVWPGTVEEARRHLSDCGVTVEQGPVPRNGARGPGQSLYFRDPDGSLLELISYEAAEASLGADSFVVDRE